jgi:hypothetical protein
MRTIVIDDEQIRQILSAELPIELIDSQGRIVGVIEEILDNEAVREYRSRMNISTPDQNKN